MGICGSKSVRAGSPRPAQQPAVPLQAQAPAHAADQPAATHPAAAGGLQSAAGAGAGPSSPALRPGSRRPQWANAAAQTQSAKRPPPGLSFSAVPEAWLHPEHLPQTLQTTQADPVFALLSTEQREHMVQAVCGHADEATAAAALKALWPHAQHLSAGELSAMLHRTLQLTQPGDLFEATSLAVQQAHALKDADVEQLLDRALTEPQTPRGCAVHHAALALIPRLDEANQNRMLQTIERLPTKADAERALCTLAPMWDSIACARGKDQALHKGISSSDEKAQLAMLSAFAQHLPALSGRTVEILGGTVGEIANEKLRAQAVAALCEHLPHLQESDRNRVLTLADQCLDAGSPALLTALARHAAHLSPTLRPIALLHLPLLSQPERTQALLGAHQSMKDLPEDERRQIADLTLRTLAQAPSHELFASLAAQISGHNDHPITEQLLNHAEGAGHSRGALAAGMTAGWPGLDGSSRQRVIQLAAGAGDEADRLKAVTALYQCELTANELDAVDRLAVGFQDPANLTLALSAMLEASKQQTDSVFHSKTARALRKVTDLAVSDSPQAAAAIKAAAGFAAELRSRDQEELVLLCKQTEAGGHHLAERVTSAAPSLPWLLPEFALEVIELAATLAEPEARGAALGALCAQAGKLGGVTLDRLVDHAAAFYETCDLGQFTPPAALAEAMDSMQIPQRQRLAALVVSRGAQLEPGFVTQVMRGVEHVPPATRGPLLEKVDKLPARTRALALQTLAERFEHLSGSEHKQVFSRAEDAGHPALPTATWLALANAKRQADRAERERKAFVAPHAGRPSAGELIARAVPHHYRRRHGAEAYAKMPHPTPDGLPAGTPRDTEATVAEVAATSIDELRKSLAPLTPAEIKFVDRFLRTPFYATHVTDAVITHAGVADDDKDWATLYSRDELLDRDISFDLTHSEGDLDLKNSDFVFFSIEAGHAQKKPASRFGQTKYRFDFKDPRFTDAAWLSTTEALKNLTPPVSENHLKGFGVADKRLVAKRKTGPEGVLAGSNMLPGLALLIVADGRKLSSAAQAAILATAEGDEMDALLNRLYRPEIKVPKRFIGPISDTSPVIDSQASLPY
jgi:hypothetical protein